MTSKILTPFWELVASCLDFLICIPAAFIDYHTVITSMACESGNFSAPFIDWLTLSGKT